MMDEFDAACLAAALLDMEEPSDNIDDLLTIEEALGEKFHLDLLDLARLAEALLPLCACGVSPITGAKYRGFAKDGCFILKTEAQ